MDTRIAVLAYHLEFDPDDIVNDSDNAFSINPRRVKRGKSPEYYKQYAMDLKSILSPLFFDNPITTHVLQAIPDVYQLLKPYMPTESPPGEIHYWVNGLYFLTDYKYWLDHYNDWHIYALHAAFNGEEIEDKREWMYVDSGQYLVLTDDEAERYAKESVENYIDDCMEIPDNVSKYFDRESFIQDVLDMDGRGHVLSGYDGEEREVSGYDVWDDTELELDDDIDIEQTFYIYRIN